MIIFDRQMSKVNSMAACRRRTLDHDIISGPASKWVGIYISAASFLLDLLLEDELLEAEGVFEDILDVVLLAILGAGEHNPSSKLLAILGTGELANKLDLGALLVLLLPLKVMTSSMIGL